MLPQAETRLWMMQRKMSPTRVIALCFLGLILLGGVLLWLPVSHRAGQQVDFLDALFTSTSAVCVTGLVVVDTADTFNLFGRIVILLLIQAGGFGVATLGVGIAVLARRRVGYRERKLVKEALNVSNFSGIVKLIRMALALTVSVEAVGAALSFCVFSQTMPFWRALGMGIFHAVSAFNNAGFDLMGGGRGLMDFADHTALNLITCALIIVGGLGYLVLWEILTKGSFRRFSLQSKVVITVTAALLVVGTIILRLAESDWTWLNAFFHSVSARTAGFATRDLSQLSQAGLLSMCALMFVGASPGSTGGGIKTTTLFALLVALRSTATNTKRQAFRRRISDEVVSKAFTIAAMAILLVLLVTLLLSFLEPEFSLGQLLFEAVSAFATVGLSAGVTPGLCAASRVILILTMFIGRLGPLTAATLLIYKNTSTVQYTEEDLVIG